MTFEQAKSIAKDCHIVETLNKPWYTTDAVQAEDSSVVSKSSNARRVVGMTELERPPISSSPTRPSTTRVMGPLVVATSPT